MSVIIASVQLMNPTFPNEIIRILSDFQMSPNQLNLEIEESALDGNNATAYQVVDTLKNMGIRLSLAAYGTGKSSVDHLNHLPIDSLKIDRSFVMTMGSQETSRSMVMSVLAKASALDIDVVAEGIENRMTLGKLKDAKCKIVQGNLISRPKPAGFLEPMLVRRKYKLADVLELT